MDMTDFIREDNIRYDYSRSLIVMIKLTINYAKYAVAKGDVKSCENLIDLGNETINLLRDTITGRSLFNQFYKPQENAT